MIQKKNTVTKKMGATKITHVALVLDESGSMESMRDAAIGLYNDQADAIKTNATKGGTTFASLFKFGSSTPPHVTEAFHHQSALAIPRLDRSSYIPQNGTPMRDGIGLAITRLEPEDDGGADTAFLVIVVTDGMENQSREWDADRLRAKINELTATGRWTFVVYGANISLTDLQDQGIHIMAGNFGTYEPNSASVRGMSVNMVASSASYFAGRAAGATATMDFADPNGAQASTATHPKGKRRGLPK